MAIYNTYFSVLGLQDSLGVLPNLGVLPGLGRLDDLGEYAFSPTSLFLNGEQGVWYDPSDLTPEKVSWRRNLLTYSQDFENAAWTKSNASILSNLALYSQDFDNAAWAAQIGGTGITPTRTANFAAAPDGTMTADRLQFSLGGGTTTSDQSYIIQSIIPASTACVGSFYVKLNSGTADIYVRTGNFATTYTVTSSWTRVEVSCTSANTSNTFGIGLRGGQTPANTNTADILVWGAQLVPGSTAQTYTRSLATAAPIQFADPLGGTLADKVLVAATTGQHYLSRSALSVTAGVTYTLTVYAKKDERIWFAIYLGGGGTGTATAYYNLNTGVVGTTSGGLTSASITDVGSGWYRCAITAVASGGSLTPELHPVSADGSFSNTGDGVSGIYVYGAQVEQASTASAYQRITDFSSDFLAAFPTHALYQESTGVTPVTALGQSVGLVLDKRLGALTNLGAERITNGNFASGSTGWTLPSGAVAIDGALVCTGLTSASNCVNVGTIVAGRWYQATFEIRNYITGSVSFGFGAQVLSPRNAAGVYTEIFYATVSDFIDVRRRITDFTGTVDNISVREVPGNHAIQATSAARPTLQARSNLLTRTEEFDNAAWSKVNTSVTANNTTAPDGTATADLLIATANNGRLGRTDVTTTSGVTYTISAWLKRKTGTGDVYFYSQSASGFFSPNLNITSEWARYTWTFTATSTTADIRLPQLQTSGDEVYLWGAQVEQSGSPTTYQRVVTATDYADVGLPRNLTFDGVDDSLATAGNVDFATWTVGSRRNLLTVPSMFDASPWTVFRATITPNTATAPDGTLTADALFETAVTNTHVVSRSSAAVSGAGTFSCYVKANGRTWCSLYTDFSGALRTFFNLSNGTVGTSGHTSAAIVDAGNGWYRCSVVIADLSGFPREFGVESALSNGNSTQLGDPALGILLWGAQLEVGSTATAFQDVGTDKVTLFSGVTKLSDAGAGAVTELSVDSSLNNGSFALFVPINTTGDYRWRSKGTVAADATPSIGSGPQTKVLTGIGNIGGDIAATRMNGVDAATTTTDQGTGNYGSYLLYIGRRGGSAFPFNGRLFQLVIRGAATDSVTVGNAERWVGQLTGVNL